ncbi:flagellar motor protein MotB [Burkholderia sp. SRS-W-2-2016]|uniref:OmpA family protein n=1 Tax=Burkholderia sp. SRS-W-2-2016 TaxID=1926878 RepID=UPI00094B5C6B|nr:OmpA family protein [Burkholderia sp. SRS-W-2-2016]OLL28238.1 flagellar motor protein MotB [Burkholderia sp. SRS-W-2-2016]
MKSDLPVLTPTPTRAPASGRASYLGLGYPFRLMVTLAAALALAVIWLVARPGPGMAWLLTGGIAIAALLLIYLRTWMLWRARSRSADVLAALGEATADIPVRLRTRMPLVLVTGDDLAALFNRADAERFAHVGDGAIWVRADRPQDLPRLAVALRQWRDGRAPDGVVLSVVPARYTDADALTQSLRIARQAVADAARRLGSRPLPGYVAIYQRLTSAPADLTAPQWYGVSSSQRMTDAQRFESMIRAAESDAQLAANARVAVARAAGLASIVGWTQRTVIHALADRQQPAAPWALFGAGWIDCGPAVAAGNPWTRDVEMQTRVQRAQAAATPAPWPLPEPLIEAMPQRHWMSPRRTALAHVLALLACAAAFAFFFSASNNKALLARIGADLGRYSTIPAAHDAARRDALQALVADRDELDRYARLGVPLHLSFGMYRGTSAIPVLNDAIASYVPPPPPPAVITLDSMSLFDSGKAKLKDGSTRAMVGALEMIKAHPDKRILVAGYTDNVGNPQSNLTLSTARAEAVRDWLIDASGIPATQFAIQGYGDTRPIADNDSEAGRAKNRRVEITLVPDAPQA